MRNTIIAALLLIAGAQPLRTSPQTQPPSAQQAPAAAAIAPAPAIVVLDPAHGGSDTGARGPSGVVESEIVLDLARVIRVALEAQGFRVILTREGNQGPSFDDRSAMINGLGSAVFISVHVSSTGPVGTARVYSYQFPAAAPPDAALETLQRRLFEPLPAPRHPGLIEWDRAQQRYVDRSRHLAELAQIQIAQRFKGSPDSPIAAGVRQLRTIAAPAIAIEVSSVAVPDGQKLAQMGQPLAEAVARAVVDYRSASSSAAALEGGR